MKTLIISCMLLLTTAVACFAANQLLLDASVMAEANVISILNFILLITSCLSIFHFISPPERNLTPFHIFNIIFTIVFYWLALRFLVTHKEYYEGYEKLSDAEAIKKYFIPDNLFEWLKKIILVAFVFNIIYIAKNGREHFSIR